MVEPLEKAAWCHGDKSWGHAMYLTVEQPSCSGGSRIVQQDESASCSASTNAVEDGSVEDGGEDAGGWGEEQRSMYAVEDGGEDVLDCAAGRC
jgi:hypothetical protein